MMKRINWDNVFMKFVVAMWVWLVLMVNVAATVVIYAEVRVILGGTP